MVPGNPKEPTQAAPAAEGEVSQEQAQQLAEVISQAVADVMGKLEKILMALQKMGLPEDQLAAVAESAAMLDGKIKEVLGLGGEEAPAEEGQPGVVSQEGGVSGKPAL